MNRNIIKLTVILLITSLWLLKTTDIQAACVFDWEHCTWGCHYDCHVLGCPMGYSTGSRCYYQRECIDCGGGGEWCRDFVCDKIADPICGGGCFTGGTDVITSQGAQEIKNLQEGDEVFSLDTQKWEVRTSQVDDIYVTSRSAYFKIRTKDGKEADVTDEHPLYAVKKEAAPLSFWEYLEKESLTKKAIDYITNKISNL